MIKIGDRVRYVDDGATGVIKFVDNVSLTVRVKWDDGTPMTEEELESLELISD